MKLDTHLRIDQKFCGKLLSLEKERCQIELETIGEMVADDEGLVHGGFVFGLADYAAMVAVNHPHVVLGSATTKFLKPVSVGERLVANAEIKKREGAKIIVKVIVQRDEQAVFSGEFTAFILERHVLKKG